MIFTQHRFVSLANASGVFFGRVGRKSLFNTSMDTYSPPISILVTHNYFCMEVHVQLFPTI